MHRRAGSQRETVQAVTDGALIDITDMREWREERGQGVVNKPIPGWQSTLEQRGFVGVRGTSLNACKIRQFRKPPANRQCWRNVSLTRSGAMR